MNLFGGGSSNLFGGNIFGNNIFGNNTSSNNGGIFGGVTNILNPVTETIGSLTNSVSKVVETGTGLIDNASSLLSGDFLIYLVIAGGIVLAIMIFKK